jgi:small basic protein
MKAFIAGVFGMGVIRFILTVSGLPDSTVKYFSMSVVIALGALYFALTTNTHRERLHAAFFLIIPYMIVEVAALGYTWATGLKTIFHSADYSLGLSIVQHTLGHLAGGLTWEPLFVFIFMELAWLVYSLVARLFSKA